MLSQPDNVVEVIRKAAAAVQKANRNKQFITKDGREADGKAVSLSCITRFGVIRPSGKSRSHRAARDRARTEKSRARKSEIRFGIQR
jgi:hypothetical protein